ncbi:peptidoglycan editing factor PgeF [Candidatus Paracaedibacter symbiosus]|uniref:peptidoglycan editing factor PgeF n=1 Tax=Candidatus Paracaedibacter symbiosus TaxID=244582 RepID=UPI000509D346|nr:peptidoglycan editing factor PgeF [Candidatus Paracaedibacter symbiosus]
MIPLIQCDSLKSLPGIQHGFTTRQGGVSTGFFDSLNVSKGKGDLDVNVMENRRRIAVTLGLNADNLMTLNQTHTNKVEIVDETWQATTLREADALVTKTPNKLLGIMTADCVPVLLADSKNQVIAAVHAGWRGAVTGILQNTVEAMISCGAELSHIHAAIGPCIWQQSYEVDQQFYENLPQAVDLFVKSPKESHWLFDLPGFVQRTLEQQKIAGATPSKYDTYSNPDMFFSFRRKTHLGEANFGCSLSAIVLT